MKTTNLWANAVLPLFIVAAVSYAAILHSAKADELDGYWSGVVERDGRQRDLLLDLHKGDGTYAGSWMSVESKPGAVLERIGIEGDAVHFRLNELAFDGRASRGTLTGKVTGADSGEPSGRFMLVRIDARPQVVP